MSEAFLELLGWLGTIQVLLAYGLLTKGKLTNRHLTYQSLNVSGALMLGINTLSHGAVAAGSINVAWIGIALVGIVNIFRGRGKKVDLIECGTCGTRFPDTHKCKGSPYDFERISKLAEARFAPEKKSE